MRFRLWPFASFIFAVLLSLVALFGWSVSRKSSQIDARATAAHGVYQRVDDALTNIRANIYRAALLSREMPPAERTAAAQQQLQAIYNATERDINRLRAILHADQQPSLHSLRSELLRYWAALGVIQPGSQDAGPAPSEDRREQREIVLTLTEQMDNLNEASIRQQEAEIREDRRALRRFALQSAVLLLIAGLGIALGSISYLARLERRSEAAKQRAEDAEYELRRLSQQLVHAQEEERKIISRELHDEVGQVLTGLRLELGALAKRQNSSPDFEARMNSLKSLAEDALRAVRNLSLLLRPSMLDDLGLAPALKWQAKEFSRRMGIPISVDIEGDLEGLPEAYRICIYRIVQEALTNSAKHAEPTRIAVAIAQRQDVVNATIRDNGRGFPEKELRTRGLGLAGMEERIRTLQGTFSVSSQPGEGTELRIALPLYGSPQLAAPHS